MNQQLSDWVIGWKKLSLDVWMKDRQSSKTITDLFDIDWKRNKI
jgi:hypothetical protein